MNPFIEDEDDLSPETRTFARLMAGIVEEAEAISIYEQRIVAASADADGQVLAEIQLSAQREEMKHFAMQLEQACRMNDSLKVICQAILFQKGDIVALGAAAEKKLES
jgi:hypothetical protein